MPLSLYLLRHAKAEDGSPGGGDHERALKNRGRKAAALVGEFLARLEESPDLVLSSSAVRARETAELAVQAGGFHAPLEIRPSVYQATPESLLNELRTLSSEHQRVLVVGHEPTLSLLIDSLTGSEPAFPTGALARIDFERESWSELRPQDGQITWLVTPELLAALGPKSKSH